MYNIKQFKSFMTKKILNLIAKSIFKINFVWGSRNLSFVLFQIHLTDSIIKVCYNYCQHEMLLTELKIPSGISDSFNSRQPALCYFCIHMRLSHNSFNRKLQNEQVRVARGIFHNMFFVYYFRYQLIIW